MIEAIKLMILDGKIPYLRWIKRVLLVLAIVSPFAIFLMPREFDEFGEIGWKALIAVMAVRPISDLLPKVKLIKALLTLRKEFGIWSGLMILAHFVGYLILRNVSVFDWFGAGSSWSLESPTGWGTIGIIAVLPVLLTSNFFSMVRMKKWWKRVQRLSYLFFIAGGLHITMLGEDDALIAVAIVMALVFAAWGKKKCFVTKQI